MGVDTLITTYLEMRDISQFKPQYSKDPSLQITQAHVPLASFYRFLYRAVGEQWQWVDRNDWSDDQLLEWLSSPGISLYVLYVSGTPAGYVELDCQPTGTEIAYFGLISQFFRRGYGKHLLSFGVQRAWDAGASRVWVHTCNLDGPHALHTYQQCGFQIYDEVTEPLQEKYRG